MVSRIISVSGKGGVGKTTFVALLLKVLLSHGRNTPILVVDGDPAANLPEVLGLKVEKTVSEVVDRFKVMIEDPKTAIGYYKDTLLEAWIYETLIENDKFDLLVMGRGEGPGCYCYVNSVLTKIIEKLMNNYNVIIMDMEAGLEHISRRTDRHVDTMVIVTDATIMGMKTVEKILSVVREVNINVRHIYVVGNRVPIELIPRLDSWAGKIGLEFIGSIPEDPMIIEYTISGKSLLELPPNSIAIKAVEEIAYRMNLL